MSIRKIEKGQNRNPRRHGPFNWLKELDSLAAGLPRAKRWDYEYFLFARYPHLRPGDSPNWKRQFHLEGSRIAFEEQLSEWERRIAEHSEAGRVLDGLDFEQRRQLSALMIDVITDIQDYVDRVPHHKRLRKAASEKPRRERMLNRKLGKAHQAIDRLIESGDGDKVGPARLWLARVADAQKTVEDARQYYAALDPLLRSSGIVGDTLALPSVELPDVAGLLKNPVLHPIPENPIAFCMVRLYWFFRQGCGLTGNRSEVLVALLRNSFWSEYGISPVKFRPKYDPDSVESAGCPSVIEAVRRYPRMLPQR